MNFSRMLIVSGFWMLMTFSALGQCPSPFYITFNEGTHDIQENIGICGAIGGAGQNDVDIYTSLNGQTGISYQWEYSSLSNPSWKISSNTGNTLLVSSFSSTPDTYYFRLRITSTQCPAGVYSDIITLVVSGNNPTPPPSATGGSRCGTGTVTLNASGCTGVRVVGWYTSQYGGTLLQTGSPFTTPTLTSTTTYWVSCKTNGIDPNSCESMRVPVVAAITSSLPATPGTITGPATVCAGNSYIYSIAAVPEATTYTWTPPTGWTITAGQGTTTITATAGPAGAGNISVNAQNGCGTSPASQIKAVTVNASATITGAPPVSRCGTGSVTLNATSTGGTMNWYSAASGGTSLATGSPYNIANLTATTTYYVDATLGSCTSAPRTPVTATISAAPSSSNAGTNQSVCGNATLAANSPAVGTGLWTIVSGAGGTITTPNSPTSTFNGTAGTTYTLAWTISNPPCTASTSNVTITINTTPVVAPITPSSGGVCIGSTLTLSDATPGGTWSSGNNNIATVVNGVVTGVSGGTTTIYYSVSSGPCTTIVNRSVSVGAGLSSPDISFDIGSDMWHIQRGICAQIGGGGDATDIDIRTTLPGGATRQWEYSFTGTPGSWIIDPYTGSNWVILSFGSTPRKYYFRLMVTYNGCSVYSNTIDLEILPGTLPTSPTSASPPPSCNSASFTLTASGCTGTNSVLRWYDAQFAGNLLTPGSGSHPSYTTPTISSTTIYYVSCTTGNGNTACESPRTPVTVTIGAPVSLGSITGPSSVCAGQSNVTYSVTNYSNMTYNWVLPSGWTQTGGGTTNSITVSFSPTAASGNLQVSGTSSCGLSTATPLVITVTHIQSPIASTTQPTCTIATGSVVLNNLPASGTWTLTRTPGGTITGTGTSTTISGLAAGSYTYTVADASGCISSPSLNIVINTQPSTPTAPVVGTITQPDCTSPTGSVVLSGLPAGNWIINPGNITGNTLSTTLTGLVTGTHNFTVTNAGGCTSPLSTNVVINNAPTVAPVIGLITQPTCTAGSTGSVILSGLPAGNWVLRKINDNSTINGIGTPYTVTGLTPGTYTFDVHPVPGTCWSLPSANIVINTPTPPVAPTASTTVQPSCALATGTIVVTTPTGSYDYSIDGGANQLSTTFAGVFAGNHNITARSTIDITCISTPTVVIVNSQPLTPSAALIGTITDATCAVPTGSVALSGLPASGTWTLTRNPGGITTTGTGATTTVNGIPSGITYTFTVTNADGCTSVQSAGFSILPGGTYPNPPGIQLPITQPACAGGTGSVTLTGLPTPGNWIIQSSASQTYNGLGATKQITGLAPGTYTFTVHKAVAGSCFSLPSESVVIIGPPALSISSSAPSILCNGGTTTITVTASGGTGTLQYSLDGTAWQSGNTFPGRTAGNYTAITVRDANLCQATTTLNVTQPAALSASITTQTNLLCAGGSTGQATVTVTGGTAGYTYSWAPFGGTAASVTGISAGTYIVTVTDASFCTTTATVTLTEPAGITASASAPPILCNNGTTTMTVTASGGSGTLQYSLDAINFQAGNEFPGQAPGDYTITVRDANFCSIVTYLTIGIAPPAITASASAPVITCSGGTTTVTVTASGGTGALQYSLDGINFQAGNSFSSLGTGIYTITVKDDNLCTATTSVTVTSLPAIVVTSSAPAILCAGGTTTITVTASGGTGTLQYSLNGGAYQPGSTFAAQPAGTYTITVMDSNSCTTIDILTINPGAPLPVTSPIYHQ